MLKLYWKYLQKRKLEELKMQIRLAGGTVPDDEPSKDARKKAEERLQNPLKDFPCDIKYLSPDMCRHKVDISRKYYGKISKEKVWDDFRTMACLGKHSLVAKRCSMNDTLWSRYLKHGDALTLDDVKRMILFDAKRRELYPPDYRGTGEEPPPVEYLEKLKSDGRLEPIHNELNEIARV